MPNRQIKFRIYDSRFKCYHKTYVDMSLFKQEDYIFQQFTGLSDKNGKEIYEGDIVNADGYIGFIDFHFGSFHVRLDNYVKQQNEIISARQGIAYYCGAMMQKLEVIGNIFENPELIKLYE